MNKSEIAIRAAFAGLMTVGLATASQSAFAAKGDQEKCYGAVKAGKNDCAASGNACAGQVKADAAKDAWIYLPKGTCEKIVGASLTLAAADTKDNKPAKK